MRVQIILGSTRPNRLGKQVADWVHKVTKKRTDIEVELVDVLDYNLPLLDEPMPPMMNQYSKDHTKKWSEKIAEADGYIFVSAEYNHNVPAALKNAVDFLYHEWTNKSLGFVSYGSNGGSRAVESWRQTASELQMADVKEQLMLHLDTDFENYSVFQPNEKHEAQLNKVVDQVKAWGDALKPLRSV